MKPELRQHKIRRQPRKGPSKQKFTRDIFLARLREIGGKGVTKQEADQLLKLPFFAGTIGNLTNNNRYMRFVHRRDDFEIYLHDAIVLRGTLCHAWNVPFAILINPLMHSLVGSSGYRTQARSNPERPILSW